jgi:hypothetical protein
VFNEIDNLRNEFQLNGYPHFIESVINSNGSSRPEKEGKPPGSVYIPYINGISGKFTYINGISEKFKRIGNHYNTMATFKTKHTLRSSLMRTRLERDLQQMAHCIYSIPCKCG